MTSRRIHFIAQFMMCFSISSPRSHHVEKGSAAVPAAPVGVLAGSRVRATREKMNRANALILGGTPSTARGTRALPRLITARWGIGKRIAFDRREEWRD